jgi:hypothetical protein
MIHRKGVKWFSLSLFLAHVHVLCRIFESGYCLGVDCAVRAHIEFKINLFIKWCAGHWATDMQRFQIDVTHASRVRTLGSSRPRPIHFPLRQILVQLVWVLNCF